MNLYRSTLIMMALFFLFFSGCAGNRNAHTNGIAHSPEMPIDNLLFPAHLWTENFPGIYLSVGDENVIYPGAPNRHSLVLVETEKQIEHVLATEIVSPKFANGYRVLAWVENGSQNTAILKTKIAFKTAEYSFGHTASSVTMYGVSQPSSDRGVLLLQIGRDDEPRYELYLRRRH